MPGIQNIIGVTQSAASVLNLSPTKGSKALLCTVEELSSLANAKETCPIIAVYGNDPKQAYIYRKAAYEYADACLTLSSETAARLNLLHPRVLYAQSGEDALTLATTLSLQSPSPSLEGKAQKVQNMTILFVTHNFMVGGLEQVVIDIALLAQSLGHRPIISYEGIIDPITQNDVEQAGIEHMKLPPNAEERVAFLKEHNVSIVNAHYATIMAEESHALGIPYLQTIHNMYLWLNEAETIQWQKLDTLTSGYIAVSANAAMVADLRLGLPPEKMVIIPNGVAMAERLMPCPPEQDAALRTELGVPSHGIIFVQVASLNGVKAHLVTVEAFANALKTRQDIYLILLGNETDKAYTKQVQAKIDDHNLTDHILMPGYRKDVHRFLNLARSMLAPSFIEGWSLAISEALQLGVPVIATDVGGACEQFRGTSNILLPSYFSDVANLSAEAFFAALNDQHLIAKGASDLTQAILHMAHQPPRSLGTPNLAEVYPPTKAYFTHLEFAASLITSTPITQTRKKSYITQRSSNIQ